ncbi:hypothetical protein GCM10007170_35530 [Arthrobacter liuii]|uniref:Uncharacterized protein n=1 Tax=Arthrobacter liuii TaxID=1476996 RepID=A0ABQ2AW91_9MICC|nr:hypothetical protein GCM10007170_35530 [Arthrobacter liuii]
MGRHIPPPGPLGTAVMDHYGDAGLSSRACPQLRLGGKPVKHLGELPASGPAPTRKMLMPTSYRTIDACFGLG